MNVRRSVGDAARKGLVPLLDTLFVLLFTVLAVSETRDSDPVDRVRITLPEVEPSPTAAQQVPARVLVLRIDGRSRVHVAGTDAVATTRAELDASLQGALDGAPPGDTAVEIQGDRDARHGVAVELLQHLRLAGFTRVSLVAEGDEAADVFGDTR